MKLYKECIRLRSVERVKLHLDQMRKCCPKGYARFMAQKPEGIERFVPAMHAEPTGERAIRLGHVGPTLGITTSNGAEVRAPSSQFTHRNV